MLHYHPSLFTHIADDATDGLGLGDVIKLDVAWAGQKTLDHAKLDQRVFDGLCSMPKIFTLKT